MSNFFDNTPTNPGVLTGGGVPGEVRHLWEETAEAFTELDAAILAGVTPAAHALVGAKHTVTAGSLLPGQTIRAMDASTYDWSKLAHADLVSIGPNDHHSSANDPTSAEKIALAGSFGVPSALNKYLTQTDPSVVRATTAADTHFCGDGILGNDLNDGLMKSTGTGGSFLASNDVLGTMTFTASGSTAPFSSLDVSRVITFSYSGPDNDGAFLILTVPTAQKVTYLNLRGVTDVMQTLPTPAPGIGRWMVSSPKKTLLATFKAAPQWQDNNVVYHLSGTFTASAQLDRRRGSPGITFVDGGTATTPVSAICGTGDGTNGFSVDSDTEIITFTCTNPGVNFTDALIGKTLTIAGAPTTGSMSVYSWMYSDYDNNGNYVISGVLSPTSLTLAATGGAVTEVFPSTCEWSIVPFANTLKGGGDSLTYSGTTVTLTDFGASFTSADVGKNIVIVGAANPANDGTFRIASVVSKISVTYVNAGGTSAIDEFTFLGSWKIGGWTATASSTSSLTSTYLSLNAGVEEYMGTWIEILSGPAKGQTRMCQRHTATVLTPVRSFSINPGLCEFRFVRPTTMIAGSAMLSITGGAGPVSGTAAAPNQNIRVQGLYLSGAASITLGGGQIVLSHVYSDSVASGLNASSLRTDAVDNLQTSPGRSHPYTFGTENATVRSIAGWSNVNRTTGLGSILRIGHSFSLQASVWVGPLFLFKWQTGQIDSGTRVRSCHMINCRALTPNGPVITSVAGYAKTRFGGFVDPKFPGLLLWGSAVSLGGVVIEGRNEIGIDVQCGSVLEFSANVPGGIPEMASGVSANFGVRVQSNSIIQILSDQGAYSALIPRPTLTGSDGSQDFTFDGELLGGSWATAVSSESGYSDPTELARVKKFKYDTFTWP